MDLRPVTGPLPVAAPVTDAAWTGGACCRGCWRRVPGPHGPGTPVRVGAGGRGAGDRVPV